MDLDTFLDDYNLDDSSLAKIKEYLSEYLKNKDTLDNFYQSKRNEIIKISYESNFVFNKIMADFMRSLHGLYQIQSVDSSISVLNLKDDLEFINNQLNTDGYYITDIDPQICDNILEALNEINFESGGVVTKYKDLGDPEKNTIFINDQNDILRLASVQDLISDSTLLSIAQKFLDAKPILCQTNLWRSVNFNLKFSSNAQLFHRDFDHEKWIKVFIYLTDVSQETGPHCYVKGSQHKIINHDVKRERDPFINEHFPEEDVVYHCGKKGTIVFEDTRGYHKGTPVLEGSRIILQLEFALNPVAYKKFKLGSGEITDGLKEKIELYPYIYDFINLQTE